MRSRGFAMGRPARSSRSATLLVLLQALLLAASARSGQITLPDHIIEKLERNLEQRYAKQGRPTSTEHRLQKKSRKEESSTPSTPREQASSPASLQRVGGTEHRLRMKSRKQEISPTGTPREQASSPASLQRVGGTGHRLRMKSRKEEISPPGTPGTPKEQASTPASLQWLGENKDVWSGGRNTTQNWSAGLMKDGDPSRRKPVFEMSEEDREDARGAENVAGAFHWAIISCERPLWARFLSSTLMNAFLHGMQPASITIIWCKKYDENDVPSFFNNLEFSQKAKVLYLPNSIPQNSNGPVISYMRALAVPEYLGQPDLPLLITEDDVAFAAGFNAKIATVMRKVAKQIMWSKKNDDPEADFKKPNWMVNIYRGGDIQPVDEIMMKQKALWRDGRMPREMPVRLYSGRNAYHFGTQGILFSPEMSKRMAQHFADVAFGAYDIPGLMDMVIFDFIWNRYNCSKGAQSMVRMSSNSPRCVVFSTVPSLVQHIGSVSTLFKDGLNGSNHRFHMASDFPQETKLPSHDKEGIW